MTTTAEAWQATVPSMNFKQRKRLSRSAYDRRKPVYQAVSAPLPIARRARTAAFDCIKDGSFIDPCMGSGHILVYAFDVLFQIYQSVGYSEREIPNLILQNNLHGLDIDERAGQLAYFALMMKARSYNRRFFRQDSIPQPMVYSAKDDAELSEYGSLMKVDDLGEKPEQREGLLLEGELTYEEQLNTWNFHCLLSQKYDVVATNPPYMAPAPSQADWIKRNYPDSKSDLCVVFIERNFNLLRQNGFLSMITMHSWMFLSSYEKFRAKLIGTKDIINMAHLGARAFEEIGGEVVQTTAFVARSSNIANYEATYARLVDYAGQRAKEEAFLRGENRFTAVKGNFEKIPGSPMAYWVSETFIANFGNKKLSDYGKLGLGMRTGDNERFLRLWHEISKTSSNFVAKDKADALQSKRKWFPYNKGGGFRKWYGNLEFLVNWEHDGLEIKENTKLVYPQLGDNLGWKISNEEKYFCEGFAWSRISTTIFGARFCPTSIIFDTAAPMMFPKNNDDMYFILGLMSSVVALKYLVMINPTMAFQVGDVSNLPVIYGDDQKETVDSLVTENISLSRADWDSFETSWDFKRHPLV